MANIRDLFYAFKLIFNKGFSGLKIDLDLILKNGKTNSDSLCLKIYQDII